MAGENTESAMEKAGVTIRPFVGIADVVFVRQWKC